MSHGSSLEDVRLALADLLESSGLPLTSTRPSSCGSPAKLDRETRNAVSRVRARIGKAQRLHVILRWARRTPGCPMAMRWARGACGVRPRWTAPTRAERELVVLLSMGADLASVYLLERGVL